MIFIDIGENSINLDHVVNMYRTLNGRIVIEYDVQDGDGPASLTLYGDEAQAFKDFWEHADLTPGITIYKAA